MSDVDAARSTVSVGLNIDNSGSGGDPAAIRDTILRAEASGFDLAMVSDHVAVTADVDAKYPAPFLEAFTLLAWAAGVTSSIALGTTVAILPYRHPLLVAAMTDTIERLSGRRFVLGVGAGWAEQEYRALGVEYAERGQITEDFLAALAALRAGSDHNGPYASFSDVRSGHFSADVWVGGNGRAAMSRAARHAQAWHPLDITLDRLREVDAPARFGGCGPTSLAPRVKLRVMTRPVAGPGRLLGHGTWDQIEADLRELVAMGASAIVLDPDVPAVRDGADPWPWLERAADSLRTAGALEDRRTK